MINKERLMVRKPKIMGVRDGDRYCLKRKKKQGAGDEKKGSRAGEEECFSLYPILLNQ